jgi:hypothetical protein
MTRPNVKTWAIERSVELRTLLPFRTWNKHGDTFDAVPETLRITDQRVGCKCCGCPLDPGVEVIKVMAFGGYESAKKPKTAVYIHRQDCWANGFVQTVQLNGKIGVMRLRVNNRTYDAFYDLNKVSLDFPTNFDDMGSYPTGNTEPVSVSVPFMFLKDTGIRTPSDLKAHEAEQRKVKAKETAERKAAKSREAYLNPDASPTKRGRVKTYDVSSDS